MNLDPPLVQPVMDGKEVLPPPTVEDKPKLGLTSKEAADRLERVGPNALPENRPRSWFRVFFSQFASPLVGLLIIAAGVAASMGKLEDAGVILVVVVLNAIIGSIQEGRAQRSMESLRRLAPLKAKVIRDGVERVVEARELVPGDLLILASGDSVAADSQVTECAALEVAEAALTGESVPVPKKTSTSGYGVAPVNRDSMVFSGTQITAGRAKALVFATGMATELGQIARLTSTTEEPKTPLELRLTQFGRALVASAGLLFVLVIWLGWHRGIPMGEILMVAISQVVSLVPEGLPVALTIALAVGMQRMAARGAIVRRLAAVETLGSTSIICSDKTGTLTRNEMTVTSLWLPDGRWVEVSGVGYAPTGVLSSGRSEVAVQPEGELQRLLVAGVLCNDAALIAPDAKNSTWQAVGDPTEAALISLAKKGQIDVDRSRREWPRLREMPFDPISKVMATQHRDRHGSSRVVIKGAPEAVIELCGCELGESGLELVDENCRKQAHDSAQKLAEQALRVLAVAVSEREMDPTQGIEQFSGRTKLLGLIGQLDPPREEAKAAVASCQAAGIRPVMVTGDHKATGMAVAKMLGIARTGDVAIDGRELEAMDEFELRSNLGRIAVFARVMPAQKLRIVEAFQSAGHVVAMTGDGVNDAPALARADVGVAMGITGTEVAKSAAKIVLTDDSFATLVSAIEQGRLVYGNLRKLLLFLFATSVDEVLVLLSALFLGLPLPLSAAQILWINLVTEGTVTLGLVMEGLEGDEMRRAPVKIGEPLIGRAMLRRMMIMVPASVAVTLGYYVWRLGTGAPFAMVQTETFTVLAVCQWFNVLNCQSATQSVFPLGVFANRWLLAGLLGANALQWLVIYSEPLNRLFHTVPISLGNFCLIGIVASLVLWVEELRKAIVRYKHKAHGE